MSTMSSVPNPFLSAAYDDPSLPGSSSDDPPPAEKSGEVYDWCLTKIAEGERINKEDPTYDRASLLISDLMGDQDTGKHTDPSHRVVINQTKKAINTHASLLTDLRPMWEYRTQNERYKQHAAANNDLLLGWWVQAQADMELADACRYAETIGSSDLVFEYDPNFMGGDMRLLARDWRDTLAINPERGPSVQSWGGVILREPHTPARLRALYPGRLRTAAASTGRFDGVFTRVRRMIRGDRGPVSTLDGLGAKDPNARYQAVASQPEFVLYRVFVRDHSINKLPTQVLVGPPGRNWSYYVDPGKPLYPRGRCILIVDGDPDHRPLFDGPNPYWHMQWPVARLSLNRWPWLFVGMSLVHDLGPLQKAMNTSINDFLQVFSQWVHRGSIWGKNTPDNMFRTFDPTRQNWKVKFNALVGTGFQMQDGPVLPTWSMEFLNLLFGKWDELSGVANLTQLMQLRQMPSEKTIEKYLEAMTPEIRLEARQIESFLREVGGMFLPNVAQFYSPAKRMLKLGDAGQVLADTDYDPGTMIPAMKPGQPGYVPEFDASLPRDLRAMSYTKQFAFWLAPGSVLALHAMERQMMYLQLSRQGYLDFWTLLEKLEIPNVGSPPPVMLPKLGITVDEMKNAPLDPNTGQPAVPSELRVPLTITERLQAQSMLGIGQTVSPTGRKASGQAAPEMETQPDGSTTVTES